MIDNDRPEDRRSLDVKAIAQKLRHYPPFDRFRYAVTLKLASVGFCEELERGIVRKYLEGICMLFSTVGTHSVYGHAARVYSLSLPQPLG